MKSLCWMICMMKHRLGMEAVMLALAMFGGIAGEVAPEPNKEKK